LVTEYGSSKILFSVIEDHNVQLLNPPPFLREKYSVDLSVQIPLKISLALKKIQPTLSNSQQNVIYIYGAA